MKVTEIEAGDSLFDVSRKSFHDPHKCVLTFGCTIYTVCKIISFVVDYEKNALTGLVPFSLRIRRIGLRVSMRIAHCHLSRNAFF